MKVILLKDVKNVGKKDEVKEVNDGYASNFLFKNKMAVPYTKGSQKVLAAQLSQRAANEAQLEKEANELKERLKTMTFEFKLKVGKNGNVFGTVSNKQIVQALDEAGIQIDKKRLHKEEPINSLGTTIIKVDLYRNKVIGEIKVHVSEKE
ncbi:50S ribosomal protein L9 [Dubosiella muris]|uniref:50S ribosomal protein L9 n=1 Tax=Dubosiella muris TaxID=3038133 RepID=A0AC61R579_9FIRM|nr:50S ribosomal protein L9 [Dubosiella muris]TGY65140.1 50S ribosomal protein L9 [Dubosiella muris]